MPPLGIYGSNRTMLMPHYAVVPSEGVLESRMPGIAGSKIRVQTSPAMGVGFTQVLLEMQRGGGTSGAHDDGLRIARHSDLVAMVPEFLISAMWHPRLNADPAHRWLRETVVTVCREAYPGR